ncbi:T9SS type A sorting domain-containing protein [candidate division KSB1 bacterium]|nr:T9SS type A sorting domain-containing protein [candidate division KSB1 bacterium]
MQFIRVFIYVNEQTIQYTIFEKSSIKLQIIDITGSLVETLVDGQRSAGVYSVKWDAAKLSSGMYFYKIIAGGKTAVKKMLIVK